MNQTVKRYLPGGSHVSSYGHVNYMGGAPDPKQVFADFPSAVIVDGDDDWYAHESIRPMDFPEKAGVSILAYFHTGISGMCFSGIVLHPTEFAKLAEWYRKKYGRRLSETKGIRLHFRDQVMGG